jgi:hypothetical protein
MEAYPDLKANQNMMQLSEELTSTENRVAFARQAYNDQVMAYNTYRQSFPPVALAGCSVTITMPRCWSSKTARRFRRLPRFLSPKQAFTWISSAPRTTPAATPGGWRIVRRRGGVPDTADQRADRRCLHVDGAAGAHRRDRLFRHPDRPSGQLLGHGSAFGVIGIVALASGYKYLQVRGGGRAIAESLGGRLITQSTTDYRERRLLNVVEEMAIASGTPVPAVYLIDEPSINAFAAGFSPDDAVIGINQGTLDHLERDELQGVVAHEFSHILNGDSRSTCVSSPCCTASCSSA